MSRYMNVSEKKLRRKTLGQDVLPEDEVLMG